MKEADQDDALLMKEAARHIQESDYLLIATGAGFSADSGLPTYAEVARTPIYQRQGVDYGDLCRSSCLQTRPELFYGFWASCFNAYQTATPHAGYELLKKWCQDKDYFVYTSNVDGHFRREGFNTERIHEMHGAIDTWFRVHGDGSILETEPPISLDSVVSFPVDPATLEISTEDMRDALGLVDGADDNSTILVRPKVLLFDDGLEVHQSMGLDKSSDHYQAWEEQMEAKMAADCHSSLKLVVLEIGCGTRVPSVRRECEDVVKDTAERADCHSNNTPERFVHIRINPDEFEIENRAQGTTAMGIRGTSLATLQAMDAHING